MEFVEDGRMKLCSKLRRRNAILEAGATNTLTRFNVYY